MTHIDSPEAEFESRIVQMAQSTGIALYKRFTEQQSADMLGVSLPTLRRIRARGEIAYLRISQRHIQYFGFQLCDYLLAQIEESTTSSQASEPKPADQHRHRNTASPTTSPQATLEAAQRILKRKKPQRNIK